MMLYYYKLIEFTIFQYRYATKLDGLYITVAIFFSAIKGFSWPSIMIVFGKFNKIWLNIILVITIFLVFRISI